MTEIHALPLPDHWWSQVEDQLSVTGAFLKSRPPPPPPKQAICHLPYSHRLLPLDEREGIKTLEKNKIRVQSWRLLFRKLWRLDGLFTLAAPAEMSLDRRRIIHEHLATQTRGQRVPSHHKKILLLFTRRSKCTDISGYEETQVPKFAKISFLWRTFSSFRYKGFAKFIGEPESNG